MAINCNWKRIANGVQTFFLPAEENGYRAKIFSGNFLVFFVAAIAIMKLGYAFFLYYFPNNPFYADITKTALVNLANAERAKNNLPELTENQTLDQAAYLKALDMAQNGYFNHFSPAGISPWHWFDSAGYDYKYAGENLAIGFVDSGEVENAWIASPTHKANIVNNKYKDIGIAVLKANFQGNPATIVVQLFGRPSVPLPKLPAIGSESQGESPSQNASVNQSAGTKGQGDMLPNGGQQPPSRSYGEPSRQRDGETANVLGAATVADQNSLPFRLSLFFSQNFFDFLQFLSYGSLTLIVLLLLANFALKADFDHADLLAKAAGFIAIMAIFALLDQSLIAALLPRNL
jgi:Cysteine-rich secretory protein family